MLDVTVHPLQHAYLATVARNVDCECFRDGGIADQMHLAARPIAEKLRMLDALRERALLLLPESSSIVSEELSAYRAEETPPRTDTCRSKLYSTHGDL